MAEPSQQTQPVHEQIIIHASPFFKSILTGEWAETSLNPEDNDDHQEQEEQDQDQTTTNHDKLDSGSEPDTHNHYRTNPILFRSNTSVLNCTDKIEARIVLEEERPAPFQDLLMFVYPHLECVCTWQNASDLMMMSQKFDMPLLKRHVLNFLLSSVAGKPIEAMKISEENQLADLYRESSRFLLDNWQGWEHKELDKLSSKTLLKLEKRLAILERLLKLGLVNSSRDYVCPSSCPDPQHCTKLVDDKWRSAWAASFKFGPPQPSSVYRASQSLEPSLHSPALLLPHTSCQQHALRFFADLFDQMFSQFTPQGGGSSNNNNISHSASTSSATITTNTPTLDQQQQQQHNTLGPPGSGGPINNNLTSSTNNNPTTTTTTTPSTSTGFLHTSTSSSNFLNSDKSIRKAKYYLHVELFDSNEKSRLKRSN
ncbi:hypothetical protein Pst134EB_014809 [Puccinia striiformis f. sp. tritici]|nr:hypothetical protein Pst134EB_014809 [Puccinia striiformis f. sp. tritici]